MDIKRTLHENMTIKEILEGRRYELLPDDGHKSFYGKAIVCRMPDGSETLFSYGTRIMTRTAAGEYFRFWNGWSATTGRHIKAFSGLNKAGYFNLDWRYLAEAAD